MCFSYQLDQLKEIAEQSLIVRIERLEYDFYISPCKYLVLADLHSAKHLHVCV